ncbi:response regulator [Kineococcus radiotolerans]|uniref:Response regulator receiver protein n=1 Tax=Kineococcus radiotolerans (strain ATCC BAA-149 / DSM 14245 / SRS30216) TaxID=266940 RepID=A6W4T3_KINRD|nr:glycosyltransferase [Kineococcus radiotolerans]ABS01822.1 response regulator receiver protein [Kineococcus radiotolerans SRS30216 = ATCC BAA-149]
MTSAVAEPAALLAAPGRTALVVDDDEMISHLVSAGLRAAGMTVVTASDGREALQRLAEAVPDVVVSDVNMPGMDGFALVSRLRAEPATRAVPLVFLTSRAEASDALAALRLGADDYVRKPFDLTELVARVVAKLDRPPVPVDQLLHDPRTGLLSPSAMAAEVGREVERAGAGGRQGALAVLEVAELSPLRARFGARGEAELALQVAAVLGAATTAVPGARLGRAQDGRFLALLPDVAPDRVHELLAEASQEVVRRRVTVAGEALDLTPVTGWVALTDVVGAEHPVDPDADPRGAAGTGERAVALAATAAGAASMHLDLQPVRWTTQLGGVPVPAQAPAGPSRWRRWRSAVRTPFQVLLTLVVGVVVPFLVYVAVWRFTGIDLGPVAYLVVVGALVVTAGSIWVEGLLALDPVRPPAETGGPHPRASAIIAAYLPNEALTIVETVEAFLAQDYPGELQVVLAYNGPDRLPVEDALEAIAARDPRFVPLRVEGSTSKAQNVNAGLAVVSGEFVGVFDADHHPEPSSFRRAWRWLGGGYDVVQGHCVVRNGDASWVARTTAVEFESIYAVSHPGRARLHGFGVFGGSNGYWRTDLLRRTRMHGFMLTEDIDSSLRVVEAGGRIANDPALLSRELAPTTLKAVWNQRMRWAQGWFQVSLKHLPRAWGSPHLGLRQKLGMTFLLGWREVYPWISLQAYPVVAYLAWRSGGLQNLDWAVPLFVLTTLFTTSVGPGQTLTARRVAVPEIRRQRWWFLRYLFVSSFFYTEFKNVIARVAQIKEFTGEREWKVTPRSVVVAGAPPVPGPRDGSGS